ncbi:GtrA family protein [Candidatus Dojkabacteria bacterium]|nr:GtrA family protein [Candidatus Dojkabacteria bacterium]
MLIKIMDWGADLAHSIAKRIPVIGKYFTDQVIRFLIIGTSAFLINFAIYQSLILLLDHLIDSNDDIIRALIVGLPFLLAYFIAYLFNFYMSKKWTFKNQSPQTARQAFKFLAVNTFNAVSGAIIIAILDNIGIPPIIGQPLFVACEAFWSYLLYKLWVFKEP